jgi:hypothetical protein
MARFQSDTLQYFWDRCIGDDPDRIAKYDQAATDVDVAQANARTHGLTPPHKFAHAARTSFVSFVPHLELEAL